MVFKLTKMFLLSTVCAVIGSGAMAQVTMNSLDQNADQSQGQYMPMNMGYAGFSSLGMTQAAWLDPMQNWQKARRAPLTPNIIGARIWFCRFVCVKV